MIQGSLDLTGNIDLNNGIKALNDINIDGNVKNSHDSVIFSEEGDINIDTTNVSFTGLIYAPHGDINIDVDNLNLNSAVIIGETISIDCKNANINYGNNVAEKIGNESDFEATLYAFASYNKENNSLEIKWNSNYKPENYEIWVSDDNKKYNSVSVVSNANSYSYTITDDFEKKYFKVSMIDSYGDNIESVPFVVTKTDKGYSVDFLDSDNDGLADIFENMFGTNKNKPDTDYDGLTDYQEIYITGTDPLKYDSVKKGISDADADLDGDGLSNAKEIELGTDPKKSDTDDDSLSDGDEISKYKTDPLKKDTDDDGLEDDDEIYFKTDPKNPDTNGNGVKDGNEKFSQTFTQKVKNKDCAVTEVSVSMKGTGNLQKTTTVDSVMNKDMLCTGVVGLVGEPFSVETRSKFDKATLTFKIDKTKLGNIKFDDLMFLWYNEKENNFVELETKLDSAKSTASIETTHFSKYMVVDKQAWFDNWRQIYDSYEKLLSTNPSITSICVDCSGSMSTNDPSFQIYDHSYTCYRNLAVQGFADAMFDSDKTSIITFEYSAKELCALTSNKYTLKSNARFYNGGGTNANSAINIALKELKNESGNKSIILMSDGDVNVTNTNIKLAKDNSIKIHTVGLGSGADNKSLKEYAQETGGKHFIVKTAAGLEAIYKNISDDNKTDFSSLPDSDGDGVPDDIELSGIPMPNGELVFTDPEKEDTDGDGLTDGQEIDYSLYIQKSTSVVLEEEQEPIGRFVFKVTSDPTKVDTDNDELNDYEELLETTCSFDVDTDNDGAIDGRDITPLEYNNVIYDRNKAYEYSQKYFENYNYDYPSMKHGDCANFVSQCLYEGGLEMNSFWYMQKHDFFDIIANSINGNDDEGQNFDFEWSFTWTMANEQYNYFKDTYAINVYKIEREDSISEFVKNHPNIKVGDLLYFHETNETNNDVNHATIISKIDDSEIYFAGHSNPAYKSPLSSKIMDPDKETDDPNDYLYDYVYIIEISDAL